MEVVVVHVSPSASDIAGWFVGVHDRRQNILLSTFDFDCGFVVGVKLFCES